MPELNDPIWQSLCGGYRIPFDASVPLRQLEGGEDVWDLLWEELHHQGDVGEASYAAVPQIIRIAKDRSTRDWNFYGLISTLEIARHRADNPPLPLWLAEDYDAAWQTVLELAGEDLWQSEDPETVQAILGALAIAKGNLKLGALIAHLDSTLIEGFLEDHLAWSELYSTND